MKDILFTAFESLPFVKVGGLADVVYALPKSINNKKYRVKVAIPLFKPIKDKYKNRLKYVDSVSIKNKKLKGVAKIYSLKNESITYYFIDNKLFNRKEVYGYKDDVMRYSFFSLAVVEMMKDVTNSDMPRLVVSRQRSGDFRMGQPNYCNE